VSKDKQITEIQFKKDTQDGGQAPIIERGPDSEKLTNLPSQESLSLD
jgi:hypothetical protein